MTVQRDNLDAVSGAEVVEAAESVLEGAPVVEPVPVEPAPPTEVPVVPPVKKDDPEVKPMCCGGGPGVPFRRPLHIAEGGVDSGGDVEHDPTCPNHPSNKVSQ
ncbi:hypothetical protein UK23_07705 [Lentzea aerocolonigenes]|uniref:Uncharacterized protein n=1 Tax=Lentzea aerocolonigenes TaxID=68170 RepID=A0A0F0HA58_LENAE|nr:hypothetical protein [Lentzea aerocolonigenes]KJK51227.1 hypothetical protein UK23_07705 [Lentzea aerocolonigenes]